ncbi:RNA polymerase factor sigma-54 [Bacteroidota bacterium]
MGIRQGISVGQHLKQRQEQKLSPQLIQYIKLLTKSTLEIEERIKEELQDNPLLEAEELSGSEDEMGSSEEDSSSTDDESLEEPTEETLDWDDLYGDVEDLYGHKARVDAADREYREVPAPYSSSLIERLRDQMGLAGLEGTERAIAEQIVGSIDEDGRLRRPIASIADDIAFSSGEDVSEDQVEAVLRRVQRFDPVGIAARTLQESLLVQADCLPVHTPYRELVVEVLSEHYKAFTMKHFDEIMQKMNLSTDELRGAVEVIQKLNPRPGHADSEGAAAYVIPDFEVQREDEELIILVNRRNAPRLTLSPRYVKMMADSARSATREGDETQNFLKRKVESANWFINSINQRFDTMQLVMEAIVDRQQQFFLSGPGNLRPMILKDIAEMIEMDVSTVSRVVSGKYVQTEFGVYDLRYFFSEGVETESGDLVSNREVKTLIEHIIGEEDKQAPLSDQKITKLLQEQGFIIARRTVSKYRESSDLPVARLRKEL